MNATRQRALAALRSGPPVFACEWGSAERPQKTGAKAKAVRGKKDGTTAPVTFAIRSQTEYAQPRPLSMTKAHRTIAAPNGVAIHWDKFDPAAYPAAALEHAGRSWRRRAVEEYDSLALFGQLASQIHLLGAPLDWSSAFSRMMADEVRHAEICLRLMALFGTTDPPEVVQATLHLHGAENHSLAARVRAKIIAASCIGETLSARLFRRCLRHANVPLVREALRAILVDEAFHSSFGWEAAAMMMRGSGRAFEAERKALVAVLPGLFEHFRHLMRADGGIDAAYAAPEAPPIPFNFGSVTSAGYARAFYEGMKAEVVPGLAAIGLPEANAVFAKFV